MERQNCKPCIRNLMHIVHVFASRACMISQISPSFSNLFVLQDPHCLETWGASGSLTLLSAVTYILLDVYSSAQVPNMCFSCLQYSQQLLNVVERGALMGV